MSSSAGTLARSMASVVLFALGGAAVVLPGCTTEEIAARCDDAKCKPGNQCLPLDGKVSCRKTCSSNTDPATSCPAGYTCVDHEDGNPAFCVANTTKIEPKANGQWGFACNASRGWANPDCDGAQGFNCYGLSPTDGDAYCTRYGCATDRDCAAGYWCGTINLAPNVDDRERSIHETERVCLKRTYCSPCAADFDCPSVGGRKHHCVGDDLGFKFCTPECTNSDGCNNEARCVNLGDPGLEASVCYPRAGACVGDGSLCSPCRSDADCGDDGICVKGQYTTEKACAKKAPGDCKSGDSRGGCPNSLENPKVLIGCLGGAIESVPQNYCHGFYEISGDPSDVGCWSPNR